MSLIPNFLPSPRGAKMLVGATFPDRNKPQRGGDVAEIITLPPRWGLFVFYCHPRYQYFCPSGAFLVAFL